MPATRIRSVWSSALDRAEARQLLLGPLTAANTVSFAGFLQRQTDDCRPRSFERRGHLDGCPLLTSAKRPITRRRLERAKEDPLGRMTEATEEATPQPGAAGATAEATSNPARTMLDVQSISLGFGGVKALTDVSLDVREGEILAVIGPNGAGKTSLLNSISGLYRPQEGQILYHPKEGAPENLIRLAPHRIARLGVARSFQNIELFRHMTVLDNMMLGRHVHMKGNVLTCAAFLGPQRREEIDHRQRVEDIIDFLEIERLRRESVGTLAYGLQKRVELGRALALDPNLLLLDEPMAGMNVEEKEDMARFILDINEEWGVTCVLIEHDMGVVMDLSDRVTVLDFGQVIGQGTPDEVRRNEDVVRAYLGGEE